MRKPFFKIFSKFLLIITVCTGVINSQDIASSVEVNPKIGVDKQPIKTHAFEVEASSLDEADLSMEIYLEDIFPIISQNQIDEILKTRDYKIVQRTEQNENGFTDTVVKYVTRYNVGENFIADTAKILWELNIPEFKSRLYQLFNEDTIYIDTWNNVVGTIRTKTYTGHFEAYRIRNWPSWKDPAKDKAHLPPTPPGPNNPLGLFVVHYDENSLRYFHGTNKNNLIYAEKRDLSLGCVRNDVTNIAKMKEFIIKRVVKSADLSGWLNSQRSMIYEFAEEDKFPVRIIYKTFNIDADEKGFYIEFFRDIYNYSNPANINTRLDDPELVIMTDRENVLDEFRRKYNKGIPIEEFDIILTELLKKPEYYRKYYFEDLKNKFLGGN